MSQFHHAWLHIRSLPAAFWVVICGTLMNQIGNMAFVFLILYVNQYMGFSLSQASFTFAAFGISMLLGSLFGGILIDKIGATRIMCSSLLFNGLILLIFPMIHNYLTMIVFCLLWGLMFGLYRPASQTLVSHLSSKGMHKITFSVYRLVINLGMSIGPAIGGYLAYYSYPAIFIINGVTNLLASIILFVGLFKSPWFAYRPALIQKPPFGIKWILQDTTLRLFVFSMIPVSMIFFQHESTLPVFISRDLQLPLSFYGWLFTINTLMIVFFELPLNVMTLNWSYRTNFILGTLLITAGFAGLYFASTPSHIILLTILWTIGEMILYPASSSYIADLSPAEKRGSYMSIYSTCSNAGLLLGPLGGAFVMEQFGANSLSITCAFWGMISVILFWFVKEPNRQ